MSHTFKIDAFVIIVLLSFYCVLIYLSDLNDERREFPGIPVCREEKRGAELAAPTGCRLDLDGILSNSSCFTSKKPLF